jgi:predicted Zn-dependent protease
MGDHPGMPSLARYGLALLALVVAAWFGVSWYQAQQTGKASALVNAGGRLSAAQVRQARDALRAAGTLNPDLQVDVLRGQLELDQGRYRAAIRVLDSVTAREPLNLTAWAELGVAAAKAGDSHVLAAAGRHIAILIPVVR